MGATVREAPKSLRARREGQGGAYQYFDLCHGRQCRQYPPLISTICYWDSLAKSEGMPGTHCMHALLPRLFWRTWKLLYTSPCYTIIYHSITRVVTRNGGEFQERSCKPYCTPSVMLESQEWCWRMNKRWHMLAAHHLSSLLPEISISGDLGDLPAHLE